MKNQKFFVRFLCVLLAALMLLSLFVMVIPVRAVTESDIQALKVRRAELEKQLAEQDVLIQSLTENRSLIIDRKAALDKRIELNRESIELMTAQINAYEELIEEKAQEYSDAKDAETAQSELFRKRMRAMEEGGSYSYISFLFSASSVSDFLSRIGDIDDIMHYDQKLEEDLRESRSTVEKLKKEYEQAQQEQSAVRDELDAKKLQLDAQVTAACELIAQLNEHTENARAEYAAIEKAEAEAYAAEQQAIQQYAAEQYALQLAAQRAAAANAPAAGGNNTANAASAFNGSLIWPVDSTYVTSNYGARNAPTAGASSFHQAIDISAAAGSPIYAAADGQVVMATANSGLGNYVTIAHDGSTSTRYAHMTNYVVQPGEYVTQGQIIGYVGATGIATGNHLDFAVTTNGQSVDPLSYYDTSALTFDPTA